MADVLASHAEVWLYKKFDDLTLLGHFSGWSRLQWVSALHGGFRSCHVTIPMLFDAAVGFLRFENNPGRHFTHLVITEAQQVRWEGRVMNIAARFNGDLELTALGYWSSCRDQRVTTVDFSGHNDTPDGIIKAMLTAKCPDIASDQSNIQTAAGNVNLTLPVDRYTQDHIIDDIAPLGDSSDNTYYFAIWEDRLPFYTARSVSEVDWEVRLRDLAPGGGIEQDAAWLRNAADAYDGTTRTASAADADSQVLYPTRDAIVAVPAGTTAAIAQNARDRFVSERAIPQQTSRFTIVGDVIARSRDARVRGGGRSTIRAGDVVKVIDVIPASAASPTLDSIRTFFILEAQYDAGTGRMTLIPDRPPSTLSTMLARTKIEPER